MRNDEHDLLQLRANIFRALGHPARLRIIQLLANGPLNVAETSAALNDNVSAISQHLAVLRQHGVINDERRGRQIYYSLATPCILDLCKILSEETLKTLTTRPKQRRTTRIRNAVLLTLLLLSCSTAALLFAFAPYDIRRSSHLLPTTLPQPTVEYTNVAHHTDAKPCNKHCPCTRFAEVNPHTTFDETPHQ